MEENTVRVTGYHGTCSNAISSIGKYGLDPDRVRYRDDHWLGQGVYFFADQEKAMWWANDIAGKSWNLGSFPVVYKSGIVAEASEVLNLDDDKTLDLFYSRVLNSVAEIEADARGRYPIFTEEKFRALYFDYYKREYGISVIIYTFSKDSIRYGVYREPKDLRRQRRLAKALVLSYKEKQICVSKKECICDTRMIYHGEDEVI